MNLTNSQTDYIKKTEIKLYAYRDLKAKMDNDILDLNDLRKEKISSKSKDILYRSVSGGVRLSPEEVQEIKMDNIRKMIQESYREIAKIEAAIGAVSDDYYSDIIKLRYLEGKTDEFIAETLNCDVSTVRRNRKRILKRMAVRFYGAKAIAM